MTDAVRLHAAVFHLLLAEARRAPELECCGLLAGRDGVISQLLPAENVLHSATAYEIAPRELFALFRRMRQARLEHLGIYHSHPHTDNAPSPRDIAEACYPSTPYFIVSPRAELKNPVRAFAISDGQVTELILQLL